MYQFVLWGYGRRGKMFLNLCPGKHIVAVVDQDSSKQKSGNKDVPIISYEAYKKEYMQFDLLVTMVDSKDVQKILQEDKIYTYHLLDECPPEIVGYCGKKWFPDLPVRIDRKKRYVIYGLNAYGLLLRDYLEEAYGLEGLELISDLADGQRNDSFEIKYGFIRKNKSVEKTEEVLVACKTEKESLFCENKIQDVFDFLERMPEYHVPDLKKYKDKYVGEACFIIATGPSLRLEDLDLLEENNCRCLSVNRIYLWFADTNWRPDIYVASDVKIVPDSVDQIEKYGIRDIFIYDEAGYLENKSLPGINRYHCHKICCADQLPAFSDDITKGVYLGGSVLYDCIQIAVYMGFQTVYLLGADHDYADNQSDISNHFHKDYYKGISNPNKYIKENVEYAFQSAKQYADANGIKIYNATRGGKLEVFDRVDFDSLFKE